MTSTLAAPIATAARAGLGRSGPAGTAFGTCVLVVLGALALGTTAVAASLAGARFSLWLEHTDVLLFTVLAHLATCALAWDLALLAVGWARGRALPDGATGPWRRFGFISLGATPVLWVLLSAYAVIGTSNITLVSLELLQGVTVWRDPALWRIEGGLLSSLAALPVHVGFWDSLYHGAWVIELTALFGLLVLERRRERVLGFCASFVLLFYLGRFLGLLNPVQGPAFHRPELFAHVEGSLSAHAMQKIGELMASAPSQVDLSAALLGGVSAMPSLHVGMVSLTVFWLALASRRTLWLGVPWVLAVWTSTVLLGWHYVLDGLGGIALALGCVALVRRVLPVDGPDPSFVNASPRSPR